MQATPTVPPPVPNNLSEDSWNDLELPCIVLEWLFEPNPDTDLSNGVGKTPVPGEACFVNVQWALTDGFPNYPEWYKGLTRHPESFPPGDNDAARRVMQAWLHHLGPGHDGGCGTPTDLHSCK